MQTKRAWMFLALIIAAVVAAAQIQTPEINRQLTKAAEQLSTMSFDSAAPVTVRGRVHALVFPQGGNGMILVEANGGTERYAFLTAKIPGLAKIGFTRFTMHPGEEVIVTAVLAAGGQTIGPGLTAARADLITMTDNNRVFDRSRIDGNQAR